MMVQKYVKRPIIIEAVQWQGTNIAEIMSFCGQCCVVKPPHLIIKTLEGDHIAEIGDYIIKGIQGEFYPCKSDIFEKTYALADEYFI